jgi:hypothetical protein
MGPATEESVPETAGGHHMSHALAIRGAVGIVSTALALGIGAPAASAKPLHRASAEPAASAYMSSAPAPISQRDVTGWRYSPLSLFDPDPCSRSPRR